MFIHKFLNKRRARKDYNERHISDIPDLDIHAPDREEDGFLLVGQSSSERSRDTSLDLPPTYDSVTSLPTYNQNYFSPPIMGGAESKPDTTAVQPDDQPASKFYDEMSKTLPWPSQREALQQNTDFSRANQDTSTANIAHAPHSTPTDHTPKFQTQTSFEGDYKHQYADIPFKLSPALSTNVDMFYFSAFMDSITVKRDVNVRDKYHYDFSLERAVVQHS